MQKRARRNPDDGEVITDPRNFYTKRLKKGKSEDVFFSKPSYLCRGDMYQDKKRMGRPFDPEGYLKAGHEVKFKPAKQVPERVKNNMPYKYMEQKPDDKKNYRDAEGAVITAPNNFVTCNLKKGTVGKGTTFGGTIKHLPEDPDAQKKAVLTEIAYHKSKLPEDGKAFSSMAKRLRYGVFNNPEKVYGGPSLAITRNSKSQAFLTAEIHEGVSFRPAGPGKKKKTLGKFPSFMADPPK